MKKKKILASERCMVSLVESKNGNGNGSKDGAPVVVALRVEMRMTPITCSERRAQAFSVSQALLQNRVKDAIRVATWTPGQCILSHDVYLHSS